MRVSSPNERTNIRTNAKAGTRSMDVDSCVNADIVAMTFSDISCCCHRRIPRCCYYFYREGGREALFFLLFFILFLLRLKSLAIADGLAPQSLLWTLRVALLHLIEGNQIQRFACLERMPPSEASETMPETVTQACTTRQAAVLQNLRSSSAFRFFFISANMQSSEAGDLPLSTNEE
jgi:hypothetical protein